MGMPRKRYVRPLGLAVGAGALLVLMAGTASASITGPCDGSVTINGITYDETNDTPGNPVVVPNEEGVIITWEGSTGGPIHNHRGEIGIIIGPAFIPLENWGGENADDQVSSDGTYSLDDFYEAVPVDIVGLYRVEGEHVGDEATCTGFVYVKIEGNPLTTPVGAGSALLGLASLTGVLAAGRVRKGA